jgi:hypothetical protein
MAEVVHASEAGQQEAGQAEPQAGVDLSGLEQRLDQIGGSVADRLTEFERRLPQQQEQQQQQDPYQRNDLGQFAPQGVPGQQLPGQQPGMPGMQVDPSQTGFDPQNPYGMDPSQGGFADPYAVGDMTDQQAQQYLGQLFQQQLAPVQQQMQQLTQQNQQLMQQHREAELDRGVADLEQKYPALQDDKAADALVEHVQQLAQQGGRPDLVGEPWFYELAYKAKLADERAAGETPAQPSPALESASGASLAGGEDDPRERIKAAGGKSSLWGV